MNYTTKHPKRGLLKPNPTRFIADGKRLACAARYTVEAPSPAPRNRERP